MQFSTRLNLVHSLKTVVALTAIAASSLAIADQCDGPTTAINGVYCKTKIFQKADTELNQSYKKLLGKLKPADKLTLRNSQRAWLRNRDETCTEQSVDVGAVVNAKCIVEQTNQRVSFLNDRLRECNTVGCIASHLND